MKTTLNEIKSHHPCSDGWVSLLRRLGKTKTDKKPLKLMTILKFNGIQDAVWALRCFDYSDTCLFQADVAESVLHVFESNTNSQVLRLTIRAISDFKARKITKNELLNRANLTSINTNRLRLRNGPWSSSESATLAARHFATALCASYMAANAHAFYTIFESPSVPNGISFDVAQKEKWNEIEQLFIKHFGETT